MDNVMIEWTQLPRELTPAERIERARLQAEIDRINAEIKTTLQKIADDLNAALLRRLVDDTQR